MKLLLYTLSLVLSACLMYKDNYATIVRPLTSSGLCRKDVVMSANAGDGLKKKSSVNSFFCEASSGLSESSVTTYVRTVGLFQIG